MAEHGRGWLHEDNANEARTKMRDHRDEDHRLIWFDPRMVRQIASSICVVCTSAGGAFILSCMILSYLLKVSANGNETTHLQSVSAADLAAT